jgi:phage/plasmid-like protein (TIGR03299 family)
MLKAAGLDWEVEKRPVPGARLDSKGDPIKYQLVRRARDAGEQDILLGLVSPRYEPLQNKNAFEFFNPIVGEGAAIFETAGALGDGERVWVLAKLPGEIRVVGDDIVNKFLLLSNTHNGNGAVTVKFTPIRVVCQNTLVLALEDGEKSVKVRHTKRMSERLAEVPELLGIFKSVFESAEESFKALVKTGVDTNRLNQYLESVFPRTDEQRKKNQRPEKWEHVTKLFEEGDPGLIYIRGTLWSAYNAVTRFEDYRQTTEAGADRRLNRTWFGPGADLKLKALQKAEELARSWS